MRLSQTLPEASSSTKAQLLEVRSAIRESDRNRQTQSSKHLEARYCIQQVTGLPIRHCFETTDRDVMMMHMPMFVLDNLFENHGTNDSGCPPAFCRPSARASAR